MSSSPVSIGIAGIGNVGSEVVSQLINIKNIKNLLLLKQFLTEIKKRNVILYQRISLIIQMLRS